MFEAAVRAIILPILSHRAKRYRQLMASMIESEMDLENSITTFKYFLEQSNFCVDKGIVEKIDKDDFVEVYDKLAVQIFRSFNIYKYSTFTDEELFSKRVDQLYDRPEFYNKMLMKAAFGLFQRKSKLAENFCPTHEVVEKKEFGARVKIGYKFMAPIYDSDSGEIVGVVLCEQLTPQNFSPRSFQ